jgi:hypothetical protein
MSLDPENTARFRVRTALRRLCLLLLTPLCGVTMSHAQPGEGGGQPDELSMPALKDATIMPSPFPIAVMGRLDGLKIAVEAGYTGADAYARLNNEGQVPATCAVHFRAGSDTRRRRRQLDAGQQALIVAGIRRRIVTLRVYVSCSEAGPGNRGS